LIGSEGDATPFTDVTVENISHALHQLGYQCRGWEVMYNGHTGACVRVGMRVGCIRVRMGVSV